MSVGPRKFCFFFNDTATTEIYTLSLHDALPITRLKTVVSPVRFRPSPLSDRRRKDVRAGATAPRTSLWPKRLTPDGFAGKKRGFGACLKVRKVREPTRSELCAQPFRRDPDRRVRPAGEREDHRAARRRDPCELVEERDHVGERDELERAVLVGQLRSIGLLEAHAVGELRGRVPACERDHLLRDICADDLRFREAPRQRKGCEARARPEVEGPPRRLRKGRKCLLERREGLIGAQLVPAWRKPVELPADRAAEGTPQDRAAYHGVRRQPSELAAELCFEVAKVHGVRRWILTSWPGPMPNISAALPPLIAIEKFR